MKAETREGTFCIIANRGEEIDPLALKTTAAAIIAVMQHYEPDKELSGFLVEGKEDDETVAYELIFTRDEPKAVEDSVLADLAQRTLAEAV